MGKRLNLTGQKFGKWSVLRSYDINASGEIFWLCRCECGTEAPVRANNLKRGGSLSCGCLQIAAVTSHGMTNTRTFKSWESMKQRCLNPNAPDYPRYGGRGIKICAQWKTSFEQFFHDMGERPVGKSLDRKDHSGDYTPKNCRWATPSEQQLNRRSNFTIVHKGKKRTIVDWSELVGIPIKILRWRLDAGWSVSDALTTPMLGRGGKRLTDKKGLSQ